MHPVVVAVAGLMTLLVSAVAQDNSTYVCSSNLNRTQWVWNNNFARNLTHCAQGYHCVHGQPVALPACPSGLYFSLSLGVCVRPGSVTLKIPFGVNTCEGEAIRYGDLLLPARRKSTCEVFLLKFPTEPSQTRLYAGDPENCRAYFSCHVGIGMDWFHLCPDGTYFDDTTGDCSLLLPDPNRCAKSS